MVLLSILGWVLLGLLAVLALLVLAPIHLFIGVSAGDGAVLRAEMRLFSGRAPRLFWFAQDLGGSEDEQKVVPDRKEDPKPARRKQRRRETQDRGWIRRLLPEIPDVIRQTLGEIHIDRLAVSGWFGLPDPADTGRVWGWIAPFQYGAFPWTKIDLRPDFQSVGLGGQADIALHFTIWRLLVPGIGLMIRVAPWRE